MGYIIVKVDGSQYLQDRVKMHLKNLLSEAEGVEVLDNALVTHYSSKRIPKEYFYRTEDKAEAETFMKSQIAAELGHYLKQEGLMTFVEKEHRDFFEIIGSARILKEGANDGT